MRPSKGEISYEPYVTSPLTRPQEDFCCCGLVHVLHGAKLIGAIGTVFSLTLMVLGTVTAAFFLAFAGVFLLFVHALVLAAQNVRKPAMYIPFMALNASFSSFTMDRAANIVLSLLGFAYLTYLYVTATERTGTVGPLDVNEEGKKPLAPS